LAKLYVANNMNNEETSKSPSLMEQFVKMSSISSSISDATTCEVHPFSNSDIPEFYPRESLEHRQFFSLSNMSSISSPASSFTFENGNNNGNSDMPSTLHHSRHARRLYVGGIPVGQTSEDQLKSFFNSVITRCLEDDSETSHVLSVYMNHKKCFAFIELKTIPLTTAALDLDGILYCNSVLKIQRANEYKPELLTNQERGVVKLNLNKAPFPKHSPTREIIDTNDIRLGHMIQRATISAVTSGSVVLVGFPYDEGDRRGGMRSGAADGPKSIRHHLRKISNRNPEFGIDLSSLIILDVGDIPLGLALEEAHTMLAETIAEIVRRGGVPVLLGGSRDQVYFSAAGLMSVAGGAVGSISIAPQLDVRPLNADGRIHASSSFRLLLDDARFCHQRTMIGVPTCNGRLIHFGVQGTHTSTHHAHYVEDHGGQIMWLSRDIRHITSTSNGYEDASTTRVGGLFRQRLNQLGEFQQILPGNTLSRNRRPIMCSIDANVIASHVCPGATNPNALGFSAEEMLDMAYAAGSDVSVVLLDISEYAPEIEEMRSGKLLAHMVYNFLLGFTCRNRKSGHSMSSGSLTYSPRGTVSPCFDNNPDLLRNIW